MVRILLVLCLLLWLPASSYAAYSFSDDFESYSVKADLSGNWSYVSSESNFTLDTTGGYGGGKAIKFIYTPLSANLYFYKTITAANLPEIYVRFKVKVTSGAVGGIKFLKIFGVDNETNYANWTWNYGEVNSNQSYFPTLCFGDGTGLSNDTSVCVKTTGSVSGTMTGTVENHAGEYIYIDDGQWHTITTYNKYNTDGNADGEMWVKVDDAEVLHITSCINRNDLNTRVIERISLGDYANNYANITYFVDDVEFSDTPLIAPAGAASLSGPQGAGLGGTGSVTIQ